MMRRIIWLIFALIAVCAYCEDTEDTKSRNKGTLGRLLNKIDGNDKEKAKKKEPIVKDGDNAFAVTADTVRKSISTRKFPDVKGYYAECYADIVNQYGFWKGIGKPLTKEQQRHIRVHYRLLRPAHSNPKAPFTHLQIVDALGNLTTSHSYGPYMASPHRDDDGISDSWKNKLNTICQSEKIVRNGILVQENMYDSDGNLVLQYFPVSVSNDQIVGHFTDASGAFALLRDDDECKYVSIKLDKNGYESAFSFIDDKGYLKHNKDNVFMELKEYDENGLVQSVMSADAMGIPVLDKYGNCGWKYVYDKNSRVDYCFCVNQYGQPMQMPSKHTTEDVWKVKYGYDKWGNTISRTFYDDKWQPDITSRGVHRFIYTIKDGQRTMCKAEGLQGELVNFDTDLAVWIQEFDSEGHVTRTENRNKDSLFSSNGTCLETCQFVNGVQVLRMEYVTTNGRDSVLNLRNVRANGCDTTWNYDKKYIEIKREDSQGRQVEDAYYTLDMKPLEYYQWHKIVSKYEDRPNYSICTKMVLDKECKPADMNQKGYWREYNIEVTEMDSIGRQETISRYNGRNLIDKYGFIYTDDLGSYELVYYDSLGNRGRTAQADALYYKVLSTHNVQGNSTSWSGINEFGEPSYVMNGDWTNAAIYCTNVIGNEYYYDEKGDTIPKSSDGRKEFKSTLYKSFCIELIDSVALRHGLRTGDIIIRYGDWHCPNPTTYGDFHHTLLCLETTRKALQKKTMVVMRHDPATCTSRLVEIPLPVGTPKELGFIYHMIYMTTREKERYEQVVASGRASVTLDSINTRTQKNDKISFVFPTKVGHSNSKKVFLEGFQEDVIALGWEVFADGKRYYFNCHDSRINADNAFVNNYDSIALHYTVDAKTCKRYMFRDKNFRAYLDRWTTNITDGSDLFALADSLQKDFDEKHPVEKIVLKPHDAAERLLSIPGTKQYQTDGSNYRGNGVEKYGNVNTLYNVYVDYDSLSYDAMFLANNIINNIDFSDYCYMHNDKDYGYFLEAKGRFTECAWTTTKGIVFLSDSVEFYNKSMIVVEVADSGIFRQEGLDGKYAVLKCNDWIFGKKMWELSDVIRAGGQRKFIMLKLDGEEGNYTIGHKVKVKAPEGELGINWEWEPVSDKTFYDVYLRVRNLRKKR